MVHFFFLPFESICNAARMLMSILFPPVLPKFDVTLKVPDEVSIEEEYITVDVCAK